MHSLILTVLSLLPTATLATSSTEIDVAAALDNLHHDPSGFLHLANDGVARTYDGDGNVVDYVRLSNNQLMQHLSQLPPLFDDYLDHLHDVFDTVNGLDVVDEKQLRDPPAWLRPPPPDPGMVAALELREARRDVAAALDPLRARCCAGHMGVRGGQGVCVDSCW